MVTGAVALDGAHDDTISLGVAARVLVCRLGRLGGEVDHSGVFVLRVCSSQPPCLLRASSASCLSRPWLMDLVGAVFSQAEVFSHYKKYVNL